MMEDTIKDIPYLSKRTSPLFDWALYAKKCGYPEWSRHQSKNCMVKYTHMDKYLRKELDILKGKDIAIVGSAISILGTGQGNEIDSHEIVIRINLRVPKPEEYADVGTRTDLFYAGDILKKVGLQNGDIYKGVVVFDKNRKLGQVMQHKWHLLDPKSPYNKDKVYYGNTTCYYPTTGQLCICDCIIHGASIIYLYGFDCWNTGDRYDNKIPATGWNVGRVIETKRMRILIEDYNIITDKKLSEVIKGEVNEPSTNS